MLRLSLANATGFCNRHSILACSRPHTHVLLTSHSTAPYIRQARVRPKGQLQGQGNGARWSVGGGGSTGLVSVGWPRDFGSRRRRMTGPVRRLLPRVAVGVSGGVDSSVAAHLLQRQGFEVLGVHMSNWERSDEQGQSACPETEDVKDAQEVCKQLGIPFHRADFSRPYWTNVFAPFLEGYEQGVTPNPDVLCNREIKFAHFLRFAQERLQAPLIATGHYARLAYGGDTFQEEEQDRESPQLLAGLDEGKDQSYFLSHVPTEAFRHVLFPLGGLRKAEVRRIAREVGLVTAEKRESMGICFVGKRRLGSFLPEYMEPKPGRFVGVEDGRVLGEHGNAMFLTVGQGARIGGVSEKWFVCGKDLGKGIVYVAPGTHHPALYTNSLRVARAAFNWIGRVAPEIHAGRPYPCLYRVRYRQPLAACTVAPDPEDPAAYLRVDFGSPQRAVAVQQTLALYDGARCLGGGAIAACGPSYFEMGKPLPEDRIDWAVS